MRRAYTEGGDGAVAVLVRSATTLVGLTTTRGGSITTLSRSATTLGGSVADTQSVEGGVVSTSEAAVFTPERTESGDRSAVSEADGWAVTVADDSHRTVTGDNRETAAGRDDSEYYDRTAIVASPTDE
jgi:hypothetical protein